MVTTTTTTSSNSIHSSSTSNGGLINNANMNSSNDHNASAASAGKGRGLSATSSVWANIVKGEPNVAVAVAVAVAAALPTSSPKKAASSSSVSQVNQKIDSSATASVAADSKTTDVKSSSTSSLKPSCNHNDNNINCTSDGANVMGVMEKEPSGSPASDSAVADTNAAAGAASISTTAASVKKPAEVAWKKPSYNANAEAGLVIGDAFSWPALSKSANNVRGSTKSPSPSPSPSATPSYSPSPSDSSLKPLSLSQVSHVATSSSQKQKQCTNHANHNPTSNHASTNHQRSTKRGTNTTSNSNSSGACALMNGVLPSQSQSSSAGVSVEKPQKNSSGAPASTVPDLSMKDSLHKMNNFERGSKGRGGIPSQPDQSAHQHNSSFRRGSGGPHPRGDGNGPYRQNQNHIGRREHDHRDWNSHRSFNGRDAHPRMVNPRNNYIRPPPGSVNGAFIAPPQPVPLRSFGNAMGYPDMPSPLYFVSDPLRGVPFLPAAPFPMFFPGADPNLYSTIAKQIEYYFSSVNLCKDIFLRQKMDEQGWVPISLIAGFHRVEQLIKGIPNSIQFILDAVRAATIVETKGDRIRKRNDWMNWILPPKAINFAPIPVPQSVGVPEDGNSTNPDMNNHLQSSEGEGTSEGTL